MLKSSLSGLQEDSSRVVKTVATGIGTDLGFLVDFLVPYERDISLMEHF